MTGVDIVHVHYKGGAPAVADLVGGRVQLVIQSPPSVIPHMKAGRIRVLATTAAKRSSGLPDVPTVAEAGVPGYDTYEWYGLFAPGKTPPEIVAKLGREVARVVQTPEVRERIVAVGGEPVGGTPAAFAQFFKREMETWGALARKMKLSTE